MEAVVEDGGPAPTRSEGAIGVLTRDLAAAVTLAITTTTTRACADPLTGEAVAGGCHSGPSKIANRPAFFNFVFVCHFASILSGAICA